MRRILFVLCLFLLAAFAVDAQTSGKISGKLTYPSEFIPADMVICAESGVRVVCSNSKNKAGFVFRVKPGTATYQITLPPGSYYLYGLTSEMSGVKAYYNEFVRCGMDIKCTSKRKIILNVKAGKTIAGITVGDWY